MKTHRAYQPGDYSVNDEVHLNEKASHHFSHVLRLKENDTITLFNGDNKAYLSQIIALTKKSITVKILSVNEQSRESFLQLHLAQGIAKGDRMETVIQKATELGVTTITPLITDRCVVRIDKNRMKKKQQHWQACAISACEQSGRNVVPDILPALSFDKWLTADLGQHCLFLHPQNNLPIKNIKPQKNTLSLMVGPEGGFSDDEIAKALRHHCQAVHLGPRILRTETAAIAAISALQTLYGDLS